MGKAICQEGRTDRGRLCLSLVLERITDFIKGTEKLFFQLGKPVVAGENEDIFHLPGKVDALSLDEMVLAQHFGGDRRGPQKGVGQEVKQVKPATTAIDIEFWRDTGREGGSLLRMVGEYGEGQVVLVQFQGMGSQILIGEGVGISPGVGGGKQGLAVKFPDQRPRQFLFFQQAEEIGLQVLLETQNPQGKILFCRISDDLHGIGFRKDHFQAAWDRMGL